MNDLLIIYKLTDHSNLKDLEEFWQACQTNHLALVVINETDTQIINEHLEVYQPEIGISKNELIKDIFNQKLEQGYLYFLNWPSSLKFDESIILSIYHEIKRGFDIVIGYNQNLKHQKGWWFRFWFRFWTWFSIKQPYSDLYCFNWFVVQQLIKNERLLIEPAVYLFFQVKMHLKLLSLGFKQEIPLLEFKPKSLAKTKQSFKLFYYLLISK